MADTDKVVARAYLELAADLALRAANIASACDGNDARDIEERGDQAYAILKSYSAEEQSR